MGQNSIASRIGALEGRLLSSTNVSISHADGTATTGGLIDVIRQLKVTGGKAIADFSITRHSKKSDNGLLPGLLKGVLKQGVSDGE